MGWNSWNHFGANVKDADIRAAADALVASGLRDAGYIYVNIDDTWQGTRDAKGMIRPNSKFPDMKALADYVHARGLKFGLYSSPGPKTCAGFEGSYGHEVQDARQYAAWGVDFLKYDLCSFGDMLDAQAAGNRVRYAALEKQAYKKMHDALVSTGRPIFYSLCQYGFDNVWEWGQEVGANSWRTTGDIRDNSDRMYVIGFSQAGLEPYAGPGHWNDPDMLEVGNGGMGMNEYRAHISLWAMLAAPLLAGNDLSKMSPEVLSILKQRDVIAIDQDARGEQGRRLSSVGSLQIWYRPLASGFAVALLNAGEGPIEAHLPTNIPGLRHGSKLRDVWSGTDLIWEGPAQTICVPPRNVVLLRSAP